MQDSESIKSAIHYHVRWSDSSLDWKPFPTEDEAAILAGPIKKRNETFTIVEFEASANGARPLCRGRKP